MLYNSPLRVHNKLIAGERLKRRVGLQVKILGRGVDSSGHRFATSGGAFGPSFLYMYTYILYEEREPRLIG